MFGRTLTDICVASQTQLAFLTPSIVKQNVKYHPIPEEEVWRASILNELIENMFSEDVCVPNFTDDELKFILDHLCTT